MVHPTSSDHDFVSLPNSRPSIPGPSNPRPSTDHDYYSPLSRPGSLAGLSTNYELKGVHLPSLQGPMSLTELDWLPAWNLANAPLLRPGSPTGFSMDHEDEVVHPLSPSPSPEGEHPPSVPGLPTTFEYEEWVAIKPIVIIKCGPGSSCPLWKGKEKQPMDVAQGSLS